MATKHYRLLESMCISRYGVWGQDNSESFTICISQNIICTQQIWHIGVILTNSNGNECFSEARRNHLSCKIHALLNTWRLDQREWVPMVGSPGPELSFQLFTHPGHNVAPEPLYLFTLKSAPWCTASCELAQRWCHISTASAQPLSLPERADWPAVNPGL